MFKARYLCLFVSLYCLLSESAAAHVKWFTEPLDSTEGGLNFHYSVNSKEVLIGVAILIVVVSVSIFLDKKLPSVKPLERKWQSYINFLFNVLVGISLFCASYSGHVIAPHYKVFNDFTMFLQIMQAVIAVCFILNIYVVFASVLLIALFMGTLISFDFIELLDYINVLGVSLFVFLNNFNTKPYRRIFLPYATPLLRVFTGVGLVVLAFSEKLLNPELAVQFLEKNPWNFMQMLGFDYSDYLFVLSAGFVELAIGIVFILGTVVRINTLVIVSVMITTNIVFVVYGNYKDGLTEIIGHLPIIATAIVLLTQGAGRRLVIYPYNGFDIAGYVSKMVRIASRRPLVASD